ncbi:Coiled-coil domain-containing 130 [Chlorella sorokiniana]|uniref:Coiled-coil domain-containing 130 n=1 Tax=Chlorella sorokiniana TaxID=3076 RepID=A0A2P6TTG0_CHLSO|nr:Coiled-coil domain-containing 130 [Chlorella sorokiniana]|eukprot:PRW57360.1 Coiled-coil domain-containing 130 [Chlorella sorokiniana]
MYYPPGWDPSKGSLNKFHGSHGALGDRARKLKSEGILVIRFEMPFNVWCAGCNHLIGKGVRFNAEKKQIGMYHSTRIWSFRMRTPCCQGTIEVHTDPKNAEYVIVSGARRKVESFDAEKAGTVELDPSKRDQLDADPLARLEHSGEDKRKALATYTQIAALQEDSTAKHKDDYALNKALRRQMRGARKEEQASDARRRQLGLPDAVKLLPGTKGDALLASAQHYGGNFDSAWRHSRRQVAQESIFSTGAVAAAAAARHKKRPGGSSSGAAAAAAAAGGAARLGEAAAKQRRLAGNVKLRLSEPKPGAKS